MIVRTIVAIGAGTKESDEDGDYIRAVSTGIARRVYFGTAHSKDGWIPCSMR